MIYTPPMLQSDWPECYNHGTMIPIPSLPTKKSSSIKCTCQLRMTLMPDEVNNCDAETGDMMIPEGKCKGIRLGFTILLLLLT